MNVSPNILLWPTSRKPYTVLFTVFVSDRTPSVGCGSQRKNRRSPEPLMQSTLISSLCTVYHLFLCTALCYSTIYSTIPSQTHPYTVISCAPLERLVPSTTPSSALLCRWTRQEVIGALHDDTVSCGSSSTSDPRQCRRGAALAAMLFQVHVSPDTTMDAACRVTLIVYLHLFVAPCSSATFQTPSKLAGVLLASIFPSPCLCSERVIFRKRIIVQLVLLECLAIFYSVHVNKHGKMIYAHMASSRDFFCFLIMASFVYFFRKCHSEEI